MEEINDPQQQFHSATQTETTPNPPPPPAGVRTLYRTEGPISGVSGGLAEYFNIDPALVRLAMVAGTLIGGPIVPIGYIAAWIIIPEAASEPQAPMPPAPVQDTVA